MTRSMVVAAQPEAAETGAQILRNGGNAFDAAIAAALVQGVVDPQMCGIAGFGSCQLYSPSLGIHTCIDFHGKTPSAATPQMWQHLIEGETRDGFGFILKGNVNDLGYQAVTTPESLSAYHAILAQFGTRTWRDICAPAIAQAEAGFVVRPHVRFWWTSGSDYGRVEVIDRLKFSATGRSAYFNTAGELKNVGDRVHNPDLANTLRTIAEQGPEVFYTGAIGQRILEDFHKHGGLLSDADLRNVAPKRVAPIKFNYRGYELYTNPPPGGGIMLAQMLKTLEAFDLHAIGHNTSEYLRIVCEAMKIATADKDQFVGDPAFVAVPTERLMSASYAKQSAAKIRAREKHHVTRFAPPESKNTTHIAVVDGDGNTVSMTHSLGMPSGVITDGLGFMYNGCMAVFDPRPGQSGSIAPGKSRFSSVCPTLAFKDGQLRLALGAPGGTQIAMGVLQAIINVIDHGMTMTEAVSAPRFSATSDVIDVTNRIPRYVQSELEEQGYEVARNPNTFGIAAVHGIRIDESGRLDGGADPGHDGVAIAI